MPLPTHFCPDCNAAFPSWDRLVQHFNSTNHCPLRCGVCVKNLYEDEDHLLTTAAEGGAANAHTSHVGYFRTEAHCRVMDATAFSQYQCPLCELSFRHVIFFGHHLKEEHGVSIPGNPRCKQCSLSSSWGEMVHHVIETKHNQGFETFHFASLLTGAPSQSLPRDKNGAIIYLMYQCPVCKALFASWSFLLRHFRLSKHAVQQCKDCGIVLLPDGWTAPGEHSKATGHRIEDVYDKEKFRVGVSSVDEKLLKAANPFHLLQAKKTRKIFRCHASGCGHVCLSWDELKAHWADRNCLVVTCAECEAIMTYADATQRHEDPYQPQMMTHEISHRGMKDYSVEYTPEDFCKAFPNRYYFCERGCREIIPKDVKAKHDIECAKLRQRLTTGMQQAVEATSTTGPTAATQAPAKQQSVTQPTQPVVKSAPTGPTQASGPTAFQGSQSTASGNSVMIPQKILEGLPPGAQIIVTTASALNQMQLPSNVSVMTANGVPLSQTDLATLGAITPQQGSRQQQQHQQLHHQQHQFAAVPQPGQIPPGWQQARGRGMTPPFMQPHAGRGGMMGGRGTGMGGTGMGGTGMGGTGMPMGRGAAFVPQQKPQSTMRGNAPPYKPPEQSADDLSGAQPGPASQNPTGATSPTTQVIVSAPQPQANPNPNPIRIEDSTTEREAGQ